MIKLLLESREQKKNHIQTQRKNTWQEKSTRLTKFWVFEIFLNSTLNL